MEAWECVWVVKAAWRGSWWWRIQGNWLLDPYDSVQETPVNRVKTVEGDCPAECRP